MNTTCDILYCRLCGNPTSEDVAVDILHGGDATLKFVIQVRLQIKIISNAHYSNLVCSPCVDILKNFYEFSKKCYRVQIQLADTLRRKDAEIEKKFNTVTETKIDIQRKIDNEVNSVCSIERENESKSSYTVKRKNEDTKFCQNPKPRKRSRLHIIAENCDNVIIPERIITTEESVLPNCDIILESDRKPCLAVDANVDKSPGNNSAKKVPFSKLKNFFLTRIRLKEVTRDDNPIQNMDSSHLDDNTTENKKSSHRDDIVEKSNTSNHFKSMITDPTAKEKIFDEDFPFDSEERPAIKVKRRIPPKVNVDDIQCPYCRWFIPKEEFYPDHLQCHIKDLDSEFHKLVMADYKEISFKETFSFQNDFRCDKCNENFSMKLDFLEDQNRHENKRVIMCHVCGRGFVARKRLRAHLCSVHLERSYACDQCSYKSKNKPDLQKHRVRVHTDARIQCPLCGKLIAPYPHNLTKHMETHNEFPEFECDECPAAYRTKAGLHKHRENKHYPIPTMCSVCGTLCASQQKYSKHRTRCKKRNKVPHEEE